jgi:hypothetical protein
MATAAAPSAGVSVIGSLRVHSLCPRNRNQSDPVAAQGCAAARRCHGARSFRTRTKAEVTTEPCGVGISGNLTLALSVAGAPETDRSARRCCGIAAGTDEEPRSASAKVELARWPKLN